MKGALSLAIVFLGVGAAQASDVAIVVPRAEVRAGPSDSYYVTSELRQGERVRVVGAEKNGYVPIAPPAGSFSYLAKSAVQADPGGKTGVVIADAAPLRVGSTVNESFNVGLATLDKGERVTILGEATMTVNAKTYQFYKIAPKDEVRYLPVAAIKPPAGAASTASAAGDLPDQLPPADAAKARAMYRAYARGQATGDFMEAKRLLAELVQSPHVETRTMALNYQEYVRRHEQGGAGVGQANAARSLPRATSSYAYAEDKGPARGPRDDRIPPTKVPDGLPPGGNAPPAGAPPAAAKIQKVVGNLGTSGRGTYKGQALYVLTDSQGRTKCYVVSGGASLGGYLARAVEVSGVLAYDKELRQDVLTATGIKSLGAP